MQRYAIAGADICEEHPDGKWVLHSDAQATIARLTAERDTLAAQYTTACRIIERIATERDDARAATAAAYERAAHLIECDGDALGGKNGAAKAIRALAAEAERAALAEMLDAETRECAEICDRNDQVGGWVSRDAILARIDQRKGVGE